VLDIIPASSVLLLYVRFTVTCKIQASPADAIKGKTGII
jgi:hypothetical protein